MRRLLLLCFLFGFTSLFVGCQLTPPKQYRYIAPSTADRKCIGRCLHARKYCYQICALKGKSARSCDCATSFNTCYAACGGKVIEL